MNALRPEFPDISISKIRFLESEGLIAPVRSPSSGYRRYSESDIERLRYILSVQRDHYLPLKVIREHLEKLDQGEPPPSVPTLAEPAPGDSKQTPNANPAGVNNAAAQQQQQQRQSIRLTRSQLLEASGLSEPALTELERMLIVQPRRGTAHYGRDALTIAIAARRMSEFGIDTRHLRAFKMSVDREVGLVEQAIAPHVRRGGGNNEVSKEITQLVISFHAALVRTAMEQR
ncbi:DNA-binding transcriptional MerR regulator [Microlunatus parietis]|uniref:DNA-binding transcriptional MerR regulator n=1 Tax=Microlunatus parietis TaxID=682979 RepID=A0A7Y9I203_9ACTN|nr:MerR family transcriptional regulator [Microlunatus parietis]NYE68754.1 DNA-binding transcriptional MerR regulator [Microlunatus parietis]